MSSLRENFLSVWEGAQEAHEAALLEAHAVSLTVDGAFVTLGADLLVDNLVVTEVVRLVKSEVLSHILDIQTKRYTSFENHVQFGKDLAFLHDGLVGDKDTAVEFRREETDEFFACGLVLILEESSGEVVKEGLLKQHINQPKAEAGLQLVQEFVAMDKLLVVVNDGLVNVQSDLGVEHVRQLLAHARVVQVHQPFINLLELGRVFFIILAFIKNIVDEAHHDGEHQDAHELNAHGEAVLQRSVTFLVSITHSCESRHHPVDRGNVHEALIISRLFFYLADPTRVDDTLIQTDANPPTGDEMHDKNQGQKQDRELLGSMDRVFLDMDPTDAIQPMYYPFQDSSSSVEVGVA